MNEELLLEDYRNDFPAEVERVEKAHANPDAYIVPRNKAERNAWLIAEDYYSYCQMREEVSYKLDIAKCEDCDGDGLCEFAERGKCNAYKFFKELEEVRQ